MREYDTEKKKNKQFYKTKYKVEIENAKETGH